MRNHRTVLSWISASILMGAAVSACDSPTKPTVIAVSEAGITSSTASRLTVNKSTAKSMARQDRKVTPTPTPTPKQLPGTVRYLMSGSVTDDEGAPVGGAWISVGAMPPPNSMVFAGAKTDAAGHYELHFDVVHPLPNLPNALGYISAYGVTGYDNDMQMLSSDTTTIIKNIVMRRARTIIAGESATVAIDINSAPCTDFEDWFIFRQHCAQIHVVAPTDGTLVVEARPLQNPSAVPVVFSASTLFYRGQRPGPGKVTLLEVQAGRSYHIFVGAPSGTVSQTYTVTTTLQAATSGGQR